MKRLSQSRRRIRPLLPALVLGLVGSVAFPAHANEEEGKSGRVQRLRINTAGSVDHASYHGSITLRGAAGNAEYRWGGSTCPGQKLTDAQVHVLVSAFHERSRTRVTPRYTIGEDEGPGVRCLVGFELSAG